MNRIFKSIAILTVTLLLLLGLSVGAYAAYGEDAATEDQSADNTTDTAEDGAEETADDTLPSEATNPFAILLDAVMAHSAEILSALTLIGSLVLAFAYKKGLIPIIQGSLNKISCAVENIRNFTDSESDTVKSMQSYIEESLEVICNLTEGLCDRLETLSCELGEIKSDSTDKEAMLIIMNAQIDMMYDVFMTSALPQYQKDSVGKKILKMKEALAERAEK